MSLKEKVAIVTGGGGALGSVIVQRFLKEGANVVSSYREPGQILQLPGLAVQADVTVESDVLRLFETTKQNFGRVDIVVNTVGGFLPKKSIPELSVQEWDYMMNINLKSTFLCLREGLRRMKGESYGRIVNISAMTGLHPAQGRSAYSISKASVSLLTEIAGLEQKGSGITVNAIAPSIIDTTANRRSMPDEDFSRWVKPEHIADIICYLCSDAAIDVTGTTIRASGGI